MLNNTNETTKEVKDEKQHRYEKFDDIKGRDVVKEEMTVKAKEYCLLNKFQVEKQKDRNGDKPETEKLESKEEGKQKEEPN